MNEALAKVGMVALVLLAGFVAGLKVQEWRFDARERAKLENQIETERAGAKKARADADAVGNALVGQLRSAEQERLNFTRRLNDERNKRTPLVSGCEQSTPAANDGGARRGPMLTREFVGLWNDAMLRGTGASRDPEPVDGATDAAGEATPWEVIENLDANVSRWVECRATLTQWQDLARRRGWVAK